MTRHPLVPPQRLKPVVGAVVRLALDRAPVEPAVKLRGAGIAYVDPNGRALFLKRGADGDHAGEWCFPGGGIEAGETAEDAAVRESREEIGANPYGARSLMAKTAMDGGHYLTYAQAVKHAFTPRLNDEHTEHVWAPLASPPEPLHPGVRQALGGFAMDAEWVEGDHPRQENGQFGSGSGGAAPSATDPKAAAAAITEAPGVQAFMSQELFNEAKRVIALYSKEEVSAPLTPEEKNRATAELANHLAAAAAAKPDFDAKMEGIGKAIGSKVKLAKIKGGDRLLEKHVRDNEGDPSKMKDLVRGSLVVNSLDDVGPALAEIEKHFDVSRVNDRFAKPTNAGYSDVLINVNLPGGIQGELQIHVPEMLAAKSELGHALYNIERKLTVGSPLQEQLAELQTRVYGSARASANQALEATRSKRLNPDSSQAANSSRDKSLPSTPAFDALTYGRESGDPRSLNAMHVRSGSITTGMLSTSRNLDPSGTSESFIAASPFPSILPLAQDDEHWITVNGGEGKGQPLLISGGGVVVGGAGGNLNGKVLDPKSKSAPRESEPNKASKSADIAKALQNRNRSSAASVSQMNKIASNPNPRLLMASPTMADGAPVVTDLSGSGIAKLTGHRDYVVTGKREIPVRYAVVEADDLVASNRADGTKNEDYAKNPDKLTAINNGRTAGVQEAYARGTADAYKAALAKGERVHGIAGKSIKAMKAPVLVRIMDAADVDEHIGDESNSGMTLSLPAIEQAQNDATRFDPSAIEYNDDGSPTDASMRGFINAMPASEQQTLSPNGKPTKQAVDRMMAATFHAAYGDSELVGLMAQATDQESRNLIGGMSRAAGSMAKLKDAGELDIRELVTGAAKQIINAVRSGVSIKKFLKQGDLLTNSAEDQIAALFAENARSAKAIGERLSAAATFAFEESQKGGTDIFDDPVPQASRHDVLENLHAQS